MFNHLLLAHLCMQVLINFNCAFNLLKLLHIDPCANTIYHAKEADRVSRGRLVYCN